MKNSIFLLFLLLISCKQESKLLVLPEETPITGIDYTNELYMSYPLSIDIIKDKLLVLMHKSDNVLHIVDANNGLVVNKIGVMGAVRENSYNQDIWGMIIQIYTYMI